MIIGIDFDNTIIDYADLFSRQAYRHQWLDDLTLSKVEVKQCLIEKYGNDDHWQILQTEVYGKQIDYAKPYPGVRDFINEVIQDGDQIYIISHKTVYSNYDGITALVLPARQWLEQNQFIGINGLIDKAAVSFHSTRREKLEKIKQLKCDIFIDDLAAVVNDRKFPEATLPILFSDVTDDKILHSNKWNDIRNFYQLVNQYNLKWLTQLTNVYISLPNKITPINKGGNNLLIKVEYLSGQICIVKKSSSANELSLKNEYNALNLLNKYKILNIPKVLYYNDQSDELIQSYIPGIAVDKISFQHIDKLLEFIFKLNKLDQNQINFINVANYRNKLRDYVVSINKRWDSLNQDVFELSDKYPVFNHIIELLEPLNAVKNKVLSDFDKQIKLQKLDEMEIFSEQEKIFNPSDFGFHNTLEDQRQELYFIDFEYFVYDDKAKMVCDVIHNAGHYLTIEQKLYFLKQLNQQNFFTPVLKQRILLLINIIGFEWLLIILNIAQKDKLKQKSHANPQLSVEQIVETQYNKAKKLLNFYQTNIKNKKELFTLGIEKREIYFD